MVVIAYCFVIASAARESMGVGKKRGSAINVLIDIKVLHCCYATCWIAALRSQ